jgi:hypothetical protein
MEGTSVAPKPKGDAMAAPPDRAGKHGKPGSPVKGIRAVSGAAVVVVFTLMTGGSTEGSGGVTEPGPDINAPAPHASVEPGAPQLPVVLADAVDPTPTVVAEGARFSPYHVVVPSRRQIVLRLENRDLNVLHNLRIHLPGRDVVTAARAGPEAFELRFRSPTGRGQYTFGCDVHPTMKGTLHVIG